MAGAASQAKTPAVRRLIEKAASSSTHKATRQASATSAVKPTAAASKQRNIDDLARVLYNEARQNKNVLAMTAVGYTVKNRMALKGATSVRDVWAGYNNKQPLTPVAPSDVAAMVTARRVAQDVLDGKVADPTKGATHYYSPTRMPKEGDSVKGTDVGGGLESVPGVNKAGVPARNYVPSYVSGFERKPVDGIPDSQFKFYVQPTRPSNAR